MIERVSRRMVLGMGAVAAGGLLLGKGRSLFGADAPTRRVVIWSEGTAPRKVYPKDISGAIAEGLAGLKGWEILTATIDQPDQGVSDDLLNKTDVLMWWGHKLHGKITDATVDRIVRRVKEGGMGFIALHSSHFAKPYKKLMGTNCGWKGGYKEDGAPLKVIVKAASHPIAQGVKDFDVPHTERYVEPFEVNEPETVVFDGLYTLKDGKTQPSRQGMVWTVGKGKVFYFQPGHETYPIFFQDEIRQILRNAVQFLAPAQG